MNKKPYICPAVYCESLVLASHIAACTPVIKMHQANAGVCGAQVKDSDDGLNGQHIFTSDGFCAQNEDDEFAAVEGYCYTKQDNSLGYFAS